MIKLPTKRFPALQISIGATRFTGAINVMVGAWDQLPERPGFAKFHGASFTVIHHAGTFDFAAAALIWTAEKGAASWRYEPAQ